VVAGSNPVSPATVSPTEVLAAQSRFSIRHSKPGAICMRSVCAVCDLCAPIPMVGYKQRLLKSQCQCSRQRLDRSAQRVVAGSSLDGHSLSPTDAVRSRTVRSTALRLESASQPVVASVPHLGETFVRQAFPCPQQSPRVGSLGVAIASAAIPQMPGDRRTLMSALLARRTRWKWSTARMACGSAWRTAVAKEEGGSIATWATRSRNRWARSRSVGTTVAAVRPSHCPSSP